MERIKCEQSRKFWTGDLTKIKKKRIDVSLDGEIILKWIKGMLGRFRIGRASVNRNQLCDNQMYCRLLTLLYGVTRNIRSSCNESIGTYQNGIRCTACKVQSPAPNAKENSSLL